MTHPVEKLHARYSELDPEARMDIDTYMRNRHTMPPEERKAAFLQMAEKWFGKADERTLEFRRKCEELGFKVLTLPAGVTEEEYFAILRRRRDAWLADGWMTPGESVLVMDEECIIPHELKELRATTVEA